MADSNENYECDLERWRVRDTRYFQVQHFSKAIFSRILNIGVKSIEIYPISRQNIISGENLGVNQIPIKVYKSCMEFLAALFSALIFDLICQTSSILGLTELNRFTWKLAQNKITIIEGKNL